MRNPGPRSHKGRGPAATAEMKAAIAALRAEGADVVGTLWDRLRDRLYAEDEDDRADLHP